VLRSCTSTQPNRLRKNEYGRYAEKAAVRPMLALTAIFARISVTMRIGPPAILAIAPRPASYSVQYVSYCCIKYGTDRSSDMGTHVWIIDDNLLRSNYDVSNFFED